MRREKRPGPAHDDQNTMESAMPRAPTPIRIQQMVLRSRAPPGGVDLDGKGKHCAYRDQDDAKCPSPMIDTSAFSEPYVL